MGIGASIDRAMDTIVAAGMNKQSYWDAAVLVSIGMTAVVAGTGYHALYRSRSRFEALENTNAELSAQIRALSAQMTSLQDVVSRHATSQDAVSKSITKVEALEVSVSGIEAQLLELHDSTSTSLQAEVTNRESCVAEMKDAFDKLRQSTSTLVVRLAEQVTAVGEDLRRLQQSKSAVHLEVDAHRAHRNELPEDWESRVMVRHSMLKETQEKSQQLRSASVSSFELGNVMQSAYRAPVPVEFTREEDHNISKGGQEARERIGARRAPTYTKLEELEKGQEACTNIPQHRL